MAKYQKYAEYKDSGVEWLGEIPSHWTVTALKRYTKITDGSHHSPKIEIEGFPFVSVTDVGINNINFVDAKKITENDYSRLVKEGCKPAVNDVLLTKDGTIGRACIVTVEMPDFVILSSLGLITPNTEISSQFLYHYLVSGINVDQMNSVIHGSALKRMTINKINDLIFTFPDFYEQVKIANFLDHETAKIDTLIAKQEKLIELLKEKRQAVISHAVTEGLNPNVPMKDSGVEWLGQVPEHWVTTSLSKLSLIKRGSGYQNISMEIDGNECIPMLRISDMHEISPSLIVKNNEVIRYLVEDGDILFAGTGATAGISMVVPKECNGWVHSYNSIKIKANLKKVNTRYLQLFLTSDYVKKTFDSSFVGSAQPFIDTSNLGNLKLVLPPINEQNEIYKYLIEIMSSINELILKAELAIQLMQERRTALISAAVTGKIDVRSWQHPNQKNNNNTELSA